jgi:transposase-like protein
MQIYRIINKLGERCKDSLQIADELQPRWSGFLGCDGKVIKIHGEEWVLLTAVDLGTQDIVESTLAKGEDYISIDLFLRRVRDSIGYVPKEGVVDVDRAWIEAWRDIFPDAPLQLCVVHFERIVDREMPRRKRTQKQEHLKDMVRQVIYAKDEASARQVLNEILELKRRRYFTGKKSLYIIRSLNRNFDMLTTHFRVPGSFRDNNITESVNGKIQMRLYLIRGYKKVKSARNSLKLIALHYRFNPFTSCKNKELNGKSPLNLAGVKTNNIDWISFSQRDRPCSISFNVTAPIFLIIRLYEARALLSGNEYSSRHPPRI